MAMVLLSEMLIVWLLPAPARGVVSLVLLTAAVTALLMVGVYSRRGLRRRGSGRS
ncbi:hypothetical protein [Actinoallomurus sp. CA-150999]|uniref:hypothetical protein n=1 Tax=Actinoallomurus sp. CA-150999 TaxID=3239887 RepID=UPI003D8D38C1